MTIDLATASLAMLFAMVLAMMFRWQRSHPNFDISDLITGDNGRVSGRKFTQVGAWVVSTWGFATMIQQGKMTEWYFIGYMTVWAGLRAVQDLKPVTPGLLDHHPEPAPPKSMFPK